MCRQILPHPHTLKMPEFNYLALNLFLDEVILALVIEDDMDFLCAVAADIRAWVK